MKQHELDNLLNLHQLWLNGDEQGKQLSVKGEHFEDVRIQGNFSKAKFRDCSFVNCDFAVTNAKEANMTLCTISESDMCGSDFSNMQFYNCKFISAKLNKSNFVGANFRGSDFYDVSFTGSDISHAEFYNTVMNEVDFAGVTANNVEHLSIMVWTGLYDNHHFVYAPKMDMVWFDKFEGSLEEFATFSKEPSAQLSPTEVIIFQHMIGMMKEYKKGLEVSLVS